MEQDRVISEIDALCDAFGSGARIPSYRDLATRFESSVRTVLAALDDLERQGRIVRRAGSGTYVSGGRPVRPSATGTAPISGDGTISDSDMGRARFAIEPRVAPRAAAHTVVVIAPPDDSFFAYFGELMFSRCEARSLKVVYHPTRPGSDSIYASATEGSGEMYLCLSTALVPLAEQLKNSGHRVVAIADPGLLGRPTSVPCVHADNAHGGYVAARKLIDLGHRRIALAMVGQHYAGRPRWEGLTLAVADAIRAGLDVTADVLTHSTYEQWISNPRLAETFFARPDRPTGFCAWNDRDAMKLINFLGSIGISVPGDISVVGYDNLPDGALTSPQLSTVDQCVEQQIRFALQLLTQAAPPFAAHTTVISPTIIERATTAAPKWLRENEDNDGLHQ